MIHYEESIAEAMRKDTSTINMYGIEILTKRIPDEPRSGCLDPRELEMMKRMADESAHKEPAQNEPADAMRFTIQDLRKVMGFPNRNMNTVEIYTRYEEHDFDGNTVGIWVHWPRKPEGRKGRAGFIFIHGGGMFGGTPFDAENPCRLLAERADCVVFNIDYSLAPEKPYPNGLNDCYNALKYIYANAEKFGVDKERIGMGGDSSGGNLTAACAFRDRDEGTNMLKYQALIYPMIMFSNTPVAGYEWKLEDYEISSEQRPFIEPGILSARTSDDEKPLIDVVGMYLQHDENPDDPTISPMHAKSHKGLCKALVAVAEFDGVRIQGEIYGKLLKKAGVDTRIIRYKGVGHAFLNKLRYLPQTEDLVQEIANDLNKL